MSDYKYAYEKLLAENNLKVSDLPEDAKIGITAIKNIEKAVLMAEKKGKKVSGDTMAKIKANDKWVVNEILDFIGDKDDNSDELPHDEEEVIEDIKEEVEEQEGGEKGGKKGGEEDEEEAQEANTDPSLGLAIEKELEEMFNSGKKDWGANDIKNGGFKKTYNTLFEGYEDDGENGIETSNYKLIETSQEVFTISKK